MNETRAKTTALEAYLLGTVDFDDLLALQRRLVYEVSGDRSRGVLVLCELPHVITVGRNGSSGHIHYDPRELYARGWPIRWVNRGGGCLLHGPGQLAIVSIIALDHCRLDLPSYLAGLHEVVITACQAADAPAHAATNRSGVWAGDRLLAHIGVAVHDWVSYFGAAINVDIDLDHFRRIHVDGHVEPMTSLVRERRAPVRSAMVRQRLTEAFAERFGFDRTSIFHHHPALTVAPARQEFAYRSA